MEGFKKFILRGNVIDLAVGVIIGAAFGKIVNSIVDDIIMPPIGILLGNVDFSNFFIILKYGKHIGIKYVTLAAAKQDGAITLNVGSFINTVVSFLIVSLCVYFVVIVFNKIKDLSSFDEEEVKKATTKNCNYCYSCIPIQATKCPNCTADLPN